MSTIQAIVATGAKGPKSRRHTRRGHFGRGRQRLAAAREGKAGIHEPRDAEVSALRGFARRVWLRRRAVGDPRTGCRRLFGSVEGADLPLRRSPAAVIRSSGKPGRADRAGQAAGLVVAPEDEEQFSDAAVAYLDNAKMRAEFGANARSYAEEHFDIEAITDRFESVFELARSSRRPVADTRAELATLST